MVDSPIEEFQKLKVHCNNVNIENKENLNGNIMLYDNNNKSSSLLTTSTKINELKKRKVFAKLYLLNRDGTIKNVVEMKKLKFIIGSDEEVVDILITRPGVYPRHAEIIYDRETRKFYLNPLIDPRKSDTVRINFVPFVNKKEVLGDNDIITIGFRSFKIEFIAKVYIDNLEQPEISFLDEQNQQHQQQQLQLQNQPYPKQKKQQKSTISPQVNTILSRNSYVEISSQPVVSISSSKRVSSSTTNNSISSSSKQPPAAISTTTTAKKTSKNTEVSPSNNSSSSSSNIKSQPINDQRAKSNDILQKMKNNKITKASISKKAAMLETNKTSKTNDDSDDDNNSDDDNKDDEEEEEEDDDDESEEEKKVEEKPKPQKTSAASSIKPTTATTSTTTAIKKPTTKSLVKEEPKIKTPISKTAPTPKETKKNIAPPPPSSSSKTTATAASKNTKVETTSKTKSSTTTTTTTTKTTPTASTTQKEKKETKVATKTTTTTAANQDKPLDPKISDFITNFQRKYESDSFSNDDFKKLGKEKLEIKKSLDSLSLFSWIDASKQEYPITLYFDKIPSKPSCSNSFLNDYYTLIKEPLSLAYIYHRLKNDAQYHCKQVLNDFEKIIENALEKNKKLSDCYWSSIICKIQLLKSFAKYKLIDDDSYQTEMQSTEKILSSLENIFKQKKLSLPTIKISNNKIVDDDDNDDQEEEEEEEDDDDDDQEEGNQVQVDDEDDNASNNDDEDDDDEDNDDEDNENNQAQFSSGDEFTVENSDGEYEEDDDEDDDENNERDPIDDDDD